MSLKTEFVYLASQPGANVAQLCRRFQIARSCAHKWIKRFKQEGPAGLCERSRRPQHSPHRTSSRLEQRVVALRRQYPTWGGRILRELLRAEGCTELPAASTITDILRRHDLLGLGSAGGQTAFQQFCREQPNLLWQTDFKGHFGLRHGRCHALSVIDDHSRYLVGLIACDNEQSHTVQTALSAVFRRYGLPEAILCDNGSPWGALTSLHGYSQLHTWLLCLDVKLYHGRPYHPQTQGKVERFHRTLDRDLIAQGGWRDLPHCQSRFDSFRLQYNTIRPHRALAMKRPVECYRPSARPFPEALPPIEYDPADTVRTVKVNGTIMWHNRTYIIGKGLQNLPIALRSTSIDGVWEARFRAHPLGLIDLRKPPAKNKHSYLPIDPLTQLNTVLDVSAHV